MDLISKKELLAQTGISYGQLYRWKREGLLPEEWFIKQASFTGQETFFPKDQVLSRIGAIVEMKDDYSLEELSRILVTNSDSLISIEHLARVSEIDTGLINMLAKKMKKNFFSMGEIAISFAIHQLAQESKISQEDVLSLILAALPAIEKRPLHDILCSLLLVKARHHVCFSTGTALPFFDSGIKILGTVSIGVTMNMLQVKLEMIHIDTTTEEK